MPSLVVGKVATLDSMFLQKSLLSFGQYEMKSSEASTFMGHLIYYAV